MPEELLERIEAPVAPEETWVPPEPPEGLDTALYELDERSARADLRQQIAAMELALGRLFGSAFPRKGIDFAVAGMGGPRLLSVDELEEVRDGLAARIQEVKSDLHAHAVVEQDNRELIERMTADPAAYKWVRVYNEDIGEPGCKNWHVKPRWGPVGLLMGWWRVKISSGCPLAEGPRPPSPLMATKRKRRKQRRRSPGQPPVRPAQTPKPRPTPNDPPPPPWGSFPLSEIAVFVGVLLLIAGFFVAPPQGFVMVAVGLVLGSLAGLELTIREHFAGYRSHTLLLSAAVGVPVFGVLFAATKVPVPLCLAAGAVAFGGSAWLFTQAFRRRSGGAPFRLRS